MNHEENVRIVRDFIREFWNEGDFGCIDRFMAEGYVDHAYVPNNAEGLKNVASLLHSAFPDQSSSEESIVAQGDRVVVRLRMKGTHQGDFRGAPATGKGFEANLYREYRLANGRIAEHWALFDTASLLRHIGAELNEQPACEIKKP